LDDDVNCPCQSGKNFADCCERFITQQALPENAEQLMRSRYAAYCLKAEDYLLASWHPQYRPASLQLDDGVRYIGLEILQAPAAQESHASVEFEARLLINGRVEAMHEMSEFVQEQGRWLYTQGEMLTPSFKSWSPGRNEPCPCGSGKKFVTTQRKLNLKKA
jgi:SEC-C motif domain protein